MGDVLSYFEIGLTFCLSGNIQLVLHIIMDLRETEMKIERHGFNMTHLKQAQNIITSGTDRYVFINIPSSIFYNL